MPNTACRIASITQPIGEANRLFSSFLAIVKIICYTLSTKAVSITAASSHRFLVRELDEYFFQRSLIRIDLMQSPAIADCRLHQRFSRHLAFRVMHAQQAIRQRINGLHTIDALPNGLLRVHYTEGQMPAEALVQAAVSNGWGLHQINPDQTTLEEVF